MTYASIARGFRGGGTNGPGAPNPVYRGDSVWTYEVGSKFRAFDRRLTGQVAAYYNDYEDFIGQNSLAPAVGGGIVGINLNTGDVESYGFEAELSFRVTESWTLGGAFNIQRARITDDSPYVAVTGRQLPSDRIPFVPDYNFSAQTNYNLPLGDAGELDFNLSVVGKGDRLGASLSETFAPELESYVLTNASITWTYNQYQVAVFANNLFDKVYFVAQAPTINRYSQPRVIGVEGRISF